MAWSGWPRLPCLWPRGRRRWAAAGVVLFVAWLLRPQGDVERWLRGAVGEEATARALGRLQPGAGWSLHDLRIPGSRANLDHLVIGPRGVWVVDTKTTRDRVRGRWGQVRFGERRLDPGPTRWEAEVVADRLGVPVRPLIVVHGRGLRRRGVVCGRVRVLPAAQVTRRLRRGRRRLGGAEVAALAVWPRRSSAAARRKGAPAVADPPAPPPSPAEPRPAATVVPLRDGERGLEVLLLRRSSGGTFGGIWVFPGGQVDGADAAGLAVESNDAEVAAARRAAVREAQEEAGLELDLDRLVTLSFWLPPPEAPRRFATWFFLAPAAQQPAVVVDERRDPRAPLAHTCGRHGGPGRGAHRTGGADLHDPVVAGAARWRGVGVGRWWRPAAGAVHVPPGLRP